MSEIPQRNPFLALRQRALRAAMADREQCDLCGEVIGPEHRHLLNLASREVLCACRACSFLLDTPMAGGGMRRLIPTRYRQLMDFAISETQWAALEVPVNMAFFCHSAAAQRMMAYYPSPVGSMEAPLPAGVWEDLAQPCPELQRMERDVEALLVRRERGGAECFLVPIDACYQLVGLIRMHWKGLSGGSEVRQEIERFFVQLRERAEPLGGEHEPGDRGCGEDRRGGAV